MQNFETGKYLGVVDEHTALGHQKYNGLLLTVQRRSVEGLILGANYTLSKCMGLPHRAARPRTSTAGTSTRRTSTTTTALVISTVGTCST